MLIMWQDRADVFAWKAEALKQDIIHTEGGDSSPCNCSDVHSGSFIRESAA